VLVGGVRGEPWFPTTIIKKKRVRNSKECKKIERGMKVGNE